MAPPKITKSTFNAILKKVKEDQANPKVKEKKEVKKKEKKTKNPKDFAAHVEDIEAYDAIVATMKSQVGLLGETPVTLVNNRYCMIDNTSGQLCQVWAIGIPHRRVGTKRSAGLRPHPNDFYGCFASEMSLFYYLMYILGVNRDHPLVKHSREYHKISPKLFETKFSDEAIHTYAESLNKSKVTGYGTGSIPFLSQFGRGKKFLKSVWYFNRPDVDIPDALNWIDTDKLLEENGYEKNDILNFYSYSDFIEQQEKVKENKKENSERNKYWKKIIEEMGTDEAATYFVENFPQNPKPFGTGKKRKLPSPSSGGESTAKAQKIEDDQNLHETMKDIEGLILRSSACNFYSDEDSTGDEEEKSEEIHLSSSDSESSEEEEEVVTPTTPPPPPSSQKRQSTPQLKRAPSVSPPVKPHVVQKSKPSVPLPVPNSNNRRTRANK